MAGELQQEKLRIAYYRHGEVMLLLEAADEAARELLTARISPDKRDAMSSESRAALAKWLRDEVGIPLFDKGKPGDDPFIEPVGPDGFKPRKVIALSQSTGTPKAIYTLNLGSWIPRPVQEQDLSILEPAIADVTVAVAAINEFLARQGGSAGVTPAGCSYRVLKAGPNWFGVGANA